MDVKRREGQIEYQNCDGSESIPLTRLFGFPKSPLHEAASNGDDITVLVLLQHGADVNIKNVNNEEV